MTIASDPFQELSQSVFELSMPDCDHKACGPRSSLYYLVLQVAIVVYILLNEKEFYALSLLRKPVEELVLLHSL